MKIVAVLGALLAVLAVVAIAMDTMAAVCLCRTSELTRGQKTAQLVIALALPLFGAWIVLRLLAEADPEAVRRRWTPSDTINAYVFQLLSAEAHSAMQSAEHQVESAAVDTLVGLSHHDVGGGDAGAGAHGGH